jgi:uncharacterized glyoxalase superfamily protein PhnB
MTERKRPTLSTGIFYRDPKAALKWLEAAFGFEASMVVFDPDENLVHSELWLGDGMIMVGGEYDGQYQAPGSIGGVNTQHVHVQLQDGIEAYYERAAQAGATTVRPLADLFYGDRSFTVADPEGHMWSFGQTISQMSNAEMAEAGGVAVRERL